MNVSIWIGYDRRETAAFAVARQTVRKHSPRQYPIYGLVLEDLQAKGLYSRPIEYRPSAVDGSVMWDVISDAPMSTQHANSRFLVPSLAQSGWALFMDGDMMVRSSMSPMFDSLKTQYAAYCVKHDHRPTTSIKMDGQIQTVYKRKNWSSFLIFNCRHPSNRKLTVDVVNKLPGRDLHRLCWLEDEEIGELDPAWNFLVGYSDSSIDPKCVHYTNGVPDMDGYRDAPYADEWRLELRRWAANGPW